ncbi:MAG: hypothetical protein IBJ00_07815, partial [Alphaproteobacteria bacterium]|nr:hypothetical protein [Alphaproteobacteria bacterium]
MLRYLASILLSFILCSFILASEELEERIILNVQGIDYRRDNYELLNLERVGRYTPIYTAEEKMVLQNSEIPTYDSDTPTFSLKESEDGVSEFKVETLKEEKRARVPESAPVEDIQKLKYKKVINSPYKFSGNLLMTFPGIPNDQANSPIRCTGSGVLIGPNHILTAAHNLYDHTKGGWAQEIKFTPAHNKNCLY